MKPSTVNLGCNMQADLSIMTEDSTTDLVHEMSEAMEEEAKFPSWLGVP